MNRPLFCVFDTALGVCGIAWRESEAKDGPPVLVFLQLPCESEKQTEETIAAGAKAEKARRIPEHIAVIVETIRLHVKGIVQDFSGIAVDLDSLGVFSRQVLAACRDIKAGSTLSYGDVARIIHRPGAARAVGHALARNPVPLIIPCHRVLAANGGMGGFSAPGGVAVKARLLALEGVFLKGGKG